LDAILGPHHSVVSASATYSQPISRLVTSYDPRHVATLSQASATAPGYRSSVTNNGVGQTVTNSSVPGGQVQRLTVAVVVDSSLRPAPKLAAIGRSVTAAMGLQPGRGDKLTVATLPMPAAGPAGSSPPLGAGSTSTSLTTTIAPYLRTGFGVTLAAVLLLILIADTLSRRRRARSARPASV
jgi:flagellar biosynthesis/type III secretory pathway M-ring protein FliF/YscJ